MTLTIVLTALTISPTIVFGAAPTITWATVDYSHMLCYVYGNNFGSKMRTVTIGGTKLAVQSCNQEKSWRRYRQV